MTEHKVDPVGEPATITPPIDRFSDGKYALVPDLGLDQIVIYKVDPPNQPLPPTGSDNRYPVEDPATCVSPSTENSFTCLTS